jgi:hypothetical protein
VWCQQERRSPRLNLQAYNRRCTRFAALLCRSSGYVRELYCLQIAVAVALTPLVLLPPHQLRHEQRHEHISAVAHTNAVMGGSEMAATEARYRLTVHMAIL